MICALCHVDKKLCRSHILSKFSLNKLKNHDGKIISILKSKLLDINTELSESDENGRLREKLMCDDCEGRVCVYENYFSNFVHGGNMYKDSICITEGQNTFYQWENINTDYIKKYILSIIWRVSKSKKMFPNITIGKKHENIIGNILLGLESIDKYEVNIYTLDKFKLFEEFDVDINKIICPPTRDHKYNMSNRLIFYHYISDGFYFDIIISSNVDNRNICFDGGLRIIEFPIDKSSLIRSLLLSN